MEDQVLADYRVLRLQVPNISMYPYEAVISCDAEQNIQLRNLHVPISQQGREVSIDLLKAFEEAPACDGFPARKIAGRPFHFERIQGLTEHILAAMLAELPEKFTKKLEPLQKYAPGNGKPIYRETYPLLAERLYQQGVQGHEVQGRVHIPRKEINQTPTGHPGFSNAGLTLYWSYRRRRKKPKPSQSFKNESEQQ